MSGALLGAILAIGAAAATAAAHALVKSGDDKLAVRAVIGGTALLVMIAPALMTGPPNWPTTGWLAASIALHLLYQLLLVRSYALTDFSVAFPIARGIAPVASAGIALLWFQESLPWAAAIGLITISSGILILAWQGKISGDALLIAVATGLLTATYTLVDAGGVRAADRALHFIAWFFVLEGLGIMLIFLVLRRRKAWPIARTHFQGGIAAGVISVAGFGAALWALRLAPIGVVAGLRETSVAFGVVLASGWLGERLTRRTIVAAAMITLGAILVVAAS